MSRRPRSWRRRLQDFWEGFLWYAGLPGYYLGQVWQFLTRGWQRRFGRLWQGGLWYLGRPFSLLGTLLRRGGRFLAWWWGSRSLRLFLQSLPALLLGLGALFLTVYLKVTPEARAVEDYLRHGVRSMQEKDYETARICFERLALQSPENAEYRFHLALCTLELGRKERSTALVERGTALLSKVAPLERQGFPPAHYEQARLLLAVRPLTPALLHAAELHLTRMLQANPNHIEANAVLGSEVLFVLNRPKEAEPYLLKVVGAYPHLRLRLAFVYRSLGNQEEARRQAEQAAQHFRAQVKGDIDNHQARLNLVDANLLLKNFPEAVDVLFQALTKFPDPVYRLKLGQVYLVWFDNLEGDPKTLTANRLRLLEEALRYDVENVGVAERLLALGKGKGEDADKARKMFQGLLAQGKSPALLHLLLGMDAWGQGKTDEARKHLEEAYRLSPQAVLVANNLAYALAYKDPPDLPRALEIIDGVLKRFPNEPEFRDTRGQILAKLGRWQEAKTDLEAGLKRVSDKRNAHRMLAKVYKELGDPAMAAEHQQLAEAKSP